MEGHIVTVESSVDPDDETNVTHQMKCSCGRDGKRRRNLTQAGRDGDAHIQELRNEAAFADERWGVRCTPTS